MNVAELKALLEDADDEAEVMFLDFEGCDEKDEGTLEALGVVDIDEDASGNPVFVLGFDDDEDDEDESEEEEEPGDAEEDPLK